MSTSLLIVFIGMSVPILAAAPFYIADRRRDASETAGGAELSPGIEAPQIWPQTAVDETAADETAVDETAVDETPAELEAEIPQARTAEESNALADTVRLERPRVAQP